MPYGEIHRAFAEVPMCKKIPSLLRRPERLSHAVWYLRDLMHSFDEVPHRLLELLRLIRVKYREVLLASGGGSVSSVSPAPEQ